MTSKQVYFTMMSVVVLLGLGVVTSAYIGDHLLQSRSDKLVKLKLANAVLTKQQDSLKQVKNDIAKYSTLNKEAQAIVPQDKDQAQAVRELVKIASKTGVSLSSITFPASSLGSSNGKATTSKSQTSLSQVQPVKGLSGTYSMELTVAQQDTTSPVPYTSFVNFLNQLEHNRRTAQVTSINIQPSTSNAGLINFTLTLNLYIKPWLITP